MVQRGSLTLIVRDPRSQCVPPPTLMNSANKDYFAGGPDWLGRLSLASKGHRRERRDNLMLRALRQDYQSN